MIAASIRHGLGSIRRRPGLVALLYLVDAVIGLLVTIPAYVALRMTTSNTGYAQDLMSRIDVLIWSEIWEGIDSAILGMFGQLLWIIPIVLLWKAVSSVGVIHATAGGLPRSFWSGAGLYGSRSILLGLMSGVLMIAGLIIVGIAAGLLSLALPGRAAMIVGMVLGGLVLIAVDLVTDYARIMLVEADKPVRDAWVGGITWSTGRSGPWILYSAWAVTGLVLWSIPLALRAFGLPATVIAVALTTIVSQLALLARSAITVGWLSSEGDYFNQSRWRESPLIADDPGVVPIDMLGSAARDIELDGPPYA